MVLITLSFIILHLSFSPVVAQELQMKVNINHSQIEGTDVSVFENLQQTMEAIIVLFVLCRNI